MSKALSLDLRVRVLAAVQAGATHRKGAERFGVSAASVSRWRTREREQGDVRPKALGGDRRSKRIEACGEAVLSALGPDGDPTIEECAARLPHKGSASASARSSASSLVTPSRAKKDRARVRAKPPRRRGAARGLVRRATRSRPRAPDLHRRDLGLHQHGEPSRSRSARSTPAGQRSVRTLENHDLHWSFDATRHYRAVCHRRSRRPSRFRDLRRQGPRPGTAPGRRRHHGQSARPA